MIRFRCYTQDTQGEINLVKKAFYEMCDLPDVVHSGHGTFILIVSTGACVLLYYDV